jgi:PAS domain-containing protein
VNFSARDLLGAESARQVSWLLMARPLMALWFGGGLVVELWMALYGRDAAAPGIALAVTVAAQVLAVLIGLSARSVPPAWTGHTILLSATAATAVVIWASRPADSGLELIYLWATPYAFILVRRRWAVAHVAFAGAAWLASEALFPRTASHDGRWLLAVSMLAAISLVSWHLIVSLRGSRHLLNRAFEDSPLGMAFTDASGRLIALNGALRDLLGRDAEDVVGLPAADLLGDMSHAGPRRLLSAAGTEALVELVHSPVHDDAGHVACWSLQVHDVTARHEAEAALRTDAAQARWVDEVRAALEEDRIVLHAQPLFSIARGTPVSQELLARLRQRDGTIVAPGAFMPAVERFGLAPQSDAHVLERAARIAAGGRRIHVNLSAQSVGDPEPIGALRRALHETGADPALVTLEITETALSDDLDACAAFGREITALGCRARPGRLRHGLRHAHLPRLAAGDGDQDRPAVRQPAVRRPGLRRDRPRRRRAGPRLPCHDRRRGRGGPRDARARAGARHRRRAGLPARAPRALRDGARRASRARRLTSRG